MSETQQDKQEIISLVESLFECFRKNSRMLLENQDAKDLNSKTITELLNAIMLTVLNELERAGNEAIASD